MEIIIVDDGSTDESFFIINRYAEKDARIKVLTQTNQGAAAARNAGLRIATGEYITFVDSDDTIEEQAYEIAYETATATDADVVIFSEDNIYLPDKVYDNGFEPLNFLGSILLWNKLYKRTFLAENNFWIPEQLKCYHDETFNSIVLPNAKSVACISDKLYHYRRFRAGSIQTDSSVKKKAESIVKATQLISDYWRKNGYIQKHGHRLLDKVIQMFNRVADRISLDEKKIYLKSLLDALGSDIYSEHNVRKLNKRQRDKLKTWINYVKV